MENRLGINVNIIHNKKRTDRYNLFNKELANQGIVSYTIWDAVHDKQSTRLNIAEAHKKIVLYAKENNIKEVLIAEDDFYFPSENGFNYFLTNKPFVYDIYLGGAYTGFRNLKHENNEITRFSGLHFYMVHRRFYDTFLELPIKNSIDNELGNLAVLNKAKIFLCYPMAVIQHETKSDNLGYVYKHKDFFRGGEVFGLNL